VTPLIFCKMSAERALSIADILKFGMLAVAKLSVIRDGCAYFRGWVDIAGRMGERINSPPEYRQNCTTDLALTIIFKRLNVFARSPAIL
jgi:hypothetical protein